MINDLKSHLTHIEYMFNNETGIKIAYINSKEYYICGNNLSRL